MAALAVGAGVFAAHRPVALAGQEAAKEIVAAKLSQRITIDGSLTEPVWQAPGSTAFRRRSPSSGTPSEKTEVWVAYDQRALYIGIRAFDAQPGRINRTVAPRDSEPESDWVMVSIDGFRDRRTGFFFRVTPGGAIQDGVLFDDFRSDDSWDGVWEQATAVDSLGWTAELRIAFSQLRFPSDGDQQWGINFTRRLHRTNEVIDFTAPPRGRRGNVSLFPDLVGLTVPPSAVRVEVLPYLVLEAHDYQGEPNNPFYTGRDYGTGLGVDLKVSLGSDLTVDAAVNPDFGHVEVDPAVVNLTANETFYEEKRPFFVEGTNIFDFGRTSGLRFFHSRRIGRVPQGSTSREGFVSAPRETGILAAGKLTGRIGEGWTLGWLNAVTEREFAEVDVRGTRFLDEIEPLTYYSVARAQGSFDEGRAGLGLFASTALRDLRLTRLQRSMNSEAWTGGIDGWWHLDANRRSSLEGWLGFSRIEGSPEQIVRQQTSSRRYFQRPDAGHLRVDSAATSLTGIAAQFRFTHRIGRLTASATGRAVSPGFELNDLGYNTRSDHAALDASLSYRLRHTDDPLDRTTLGIAAAREFDFDRQLLATSYSAFGTARLKSFWQADASLSYSPEGVDVRNTRGGPSMRAPAAWSGSISLSSDPRKKVLLTASGDYSRDAAGGWSASAGGDLSWFPSPHLSISVGPWWGKYLADAGYFGARKDATATRTYGVRSIFAGLTQQYLSADLRLNWTFSGRLSLQGYLQPYHTTVTYVDFKELARPGSYDFLVYGEPGTSRIESDGAYTIDPDAAGPAATFTLYDSDFRFSSVRGTALLRWDYRAGSSLIVGWTHDRYAYRDYWQDWSAPLLESHPDNRVMVKATYWWSP